MSASIANANELITLLVKSGSMIMVGGFGLVGAPLRLISALDHSRAADLTIISNNLGEPDKGLGRTLRLGKISRAIGSYFTSNPDVAEAVQAGTLTVSLLPQGTFVEAIRAAGAGLGGFFTPAGAGTELMDQNETREIGGRLFVFQAPIHADFAFIRAHRADELGNLVYLKTARNFNPVMATAGRTVIAEVDEIVPVGELDPECVVTPHLFVDYLVRTEAPE